MSSCGQPNPDGSNLHALENTTQNGIKRMPDQKYMRNFSIIAHVDHGKTTLSDRLLELTQTLTSREMRDQTLDSMDMERERGITIKLHPVRLEYKHKDGNTY